MSVGEEEGSRRGWYMSPLLGMIVCTHRSRNRCFQVRKACVLCDKLTSGNKSAHRKSKWRKKALWVREKKEALIERVESDLDLQKSPKPRLCFFCNPDELKKRNKSGSWCTLNQINKGGAQWPQCWDHPYWAKQHALYYPHLPLLLLRLHGCISQAQMGFSAMSSRAWHALNNGRQMTSWLYLTTACAETDFFLYVEEHVGSVTHNECTGSLRSNDLVQL